MAAKFMKIKKIVIPTLTFILIASHLCGCAIFQPQEMVEAINQGQSVTIEVAEPSTYDVKAEKGEKETEVTWIQLDQLKTHSTGFRQGFDKQFNITVVTESGIGGKSGSLYVNPQGERDGNTSLKDAFRNKVFQTKYWSDATVRHELVKLVNGVYTDISDLDEDTSLLASLNAYYNLLNDSKNPDAFNHTQSLSREEFYTLFLKANNGVYNLNGDTISAYESVAGQTEYSRYASQVADTGWLPYSNHSLDGTNATGSITRLEAVYMVVNNIFPEELAKVKESDKSYTDIRNAGDLALKAGFKEQLKDESKTIREKDRWQAYSLAYSLQNPQKGVQRELYKASVVAYNLGLLPGEEMRWDESISKAEALQLLIDAYEKQNSLYGYLTEVENGKIVNNFQIQQGEEDTQDNPQGDIVVKEELPEFYEEMVYNEETGIYEPVYIPVGGSDTDQSKEGNPLEEMTPEEFDKWMLDTSDAPKPGDITPQKPTEDGNGNTNNQGNTDNQGNTGGNSGGSIVLTPEQQAELQKIIDSLPVCPEIPEGGGTGGNLPDDYVSPGINWN